MVPHPIREQLNSADGGTFIVYLDGERIVLERKGEARARLFERAARLAPAERSLTDELIAERRAAAQREQSE